MIATVHKAKKLAVAIAIEKNEVLQPVQEPTRQSKRLKGQVPIEKEKKVKVKKKNTFSKPTSLQQKKEKKRTSRRAANLDIDLKLGPKL